MHVFARYTVLFLVYSFLGALLETIFRFVTEGQLYGIHGFLHLPIMPIYGFGALIILTFIAPRAKHPVPLFFLAVVAMTVFEFVAHWLIEAVFGVRIWDYSHTAFNFDGRVSLLNSLGFGVAAILLVHALHPFVSKLVEMVPKRILGVSAAVAGVVISIDFILSVIERLPIQ